MDENSWKGLLASALSILEDLERPGTGAPEVSLGFHTLLPTLISDATALLEAAP